MSLQARSRSSSNGFVQLVALAGLIAISGLIVAGSNTALFAVKQASGLRDQLQNDVLLSSAIRYGLESGQALGSNFQPFTVTVDGLTVALHVEAEGGKIDPAAAPKELVSGYLEQAGLSATDNIGSLLDTLEADRAQGTMLTTGAIASSLGRAELDTLRQDLADFGSTGVDPRYASERVLRSVPNLSDADVQDIITQRGQSADPKLPSSPYFMSAPPRFTLVADIASADGTRDSKRFLFEVTSGGSTLALASEP